jgi:flagellar protein FlaJ
MRYFRPFEKIVKNYVKYYNGNLNEIYLIYNKVIIPLIFILSIVPIIIFLIFKNIFILSIVPIIIFLIFYPIIYSYIKKIEFKRISDMEAPFFLILLYLNSILGKGIYKTLDEISRLKIFKTIKREFIILKKEQLFNNKSIQQSLIDRATVLKDTILGKAYINYITAGLIGISLTQRLREIVNYSLNKLKESYEDYLNIILAISEGIFSIFILLPALLLSFSSVFDVSLFQLFSPLLLVPMVYLLILTIQPDLGIRININLKDIILFFVLSITELLILNISLLYKLYIIILLYFIIFFKYYLKIRKDFIILNDIPIILKTLSDLSSLGYSLSKALIMVNHEEISKYSYKFLKEISKRISENQEIRSSNWFVDYIFNTLKIIESKGAKSSVVLNELSDFIITINNIRKKLINSLRLYQVLMYLTPLLLWFVSFSFSLNKSIQYGDILIFSYSVSIAIIFTKISQFTLLKPINILIISTIALILSLNPLNLIHF